MIVKNATFHKIIICFLIKKDLRLWPYGQNFMFISLNSFNAYFLMRVFDPKNMLHYYAPCVVKEQDVWNPSYLG